MVNNMIRWCAQATLFKSCVFSRMNVCQKKASISILILILVIYIILVILIIYIYVLIVISPILPTVSGLSRALRICSCTSKALSPCRCRLPRGKSPWRP